MATLETLNEDVLYIICEYVYQISEKSPDPLGIEAIWDMPGQFPSTASGLCGELTAIQSLSMTSKYLRDFSAPWIFRNVAVEGRREEVTETLCLMERNHNLPRNVRALKFNIILVQEVLSHPSNNINYRLLKTLRNMPRLSKLHLSIPEECVDDFADIFEEASLSLPEIRTLVLGRFDDFIIKHCPNVETISTNGCQFLRSHKWDSGPSSEFIKESGKAESLAYFEMSHLWRCAQVEAIVKFMPQIKTLAMTGEHYAQPLRVFLPLLSRLPCLTTLILIDVSLLGYGFNPPGSGSTFMSPSSAQYQEVVHRQGRAAEKRVADSIFAASSSIVKVWIGNWSFAECKREGGGIARPVRWNYEERIGV